MEKDNLYIGKELSWLMFNERVLQEAKDKTNPLIERVRFLGIYSNNLDEFYKVRFADLKRKILIGTEKGEITNTQQILKKINARVLKMNASFDKLYNELLLEMARNQLFLVNERQLSTLQENWVVNYFRKYLRPHIAPIIITDETDLRKSLKDDYTYLAVEIIGPTTTHYTLLNIPSDKFSRFVLLPPSSSKKSHSLILLDNILRFCLKNIFDFCFEISDINAYAMKMTRDAAYNLDQEMDSGILGMMSLGIKQRLTAEPVRFLYQREMPNELITLLVEKLQISSWDTVIPGGRYYNFNDFVQFPAIGGASLINKPLPVLPCYQLEQHRNMFDAIREQDVLLYYPYHSFVNIIRILQQAAVDPLVVAITINIYRVAKDSKILNTMMNAVQNGKKVTVIMELQARFDEAANIKWAKRLTNAGVHVIFSPLGLKIHAKLFLIERNEENKIIRYAHIGTGNFNEKTAKTYTDFALLTQNPAITDEVKRVFFFIENPYRPVSFDYLLVSPQNTRHRLNALIDNEIRIAKKGLPAQIILKLNNLVDKQLTDKLYDASQAGVKIKLIVRGMCTLIAGIQNVSENIEIISIIDLFLEHARVYCFENGGEKDLYISSADWMTRNLDDRIEVGVKITDKAIKKQILAILELQLSDNEKARIIDNESNNAYVKNNKRRNRSQVTIHHYLYQQEKTHIT